MQITHIFVIKHEENPLVRDHHQEKQRKQVKHHEQIHLPLVSSKDMKNNFLNMKS